MPEVHASYGGDAERDAERDAGPRESGAASDRKTSVERIVAAFEQFMGQVALEHAQEFMGVGLTMSQAKVLYLVQGAGRLRMSDLSARLGVSLPTVSGVVERLVEHGLLDRRDDPADRRHVILGLTEAGASQVELIRELNAGHLRSLLSRLEAADLAAVEHAIHALAAAARPADRGPANSPSQGEHA